MKYFLKSTWMGCSVDMGVLDIDDSQDHLFKMDIAKRFTSEIALNNGDLSLVTDKGDFIFYISAANSLKLLHYLGFNTPFGYTQETVRNMYLDQIGPQLMLK